MTAQGPTASAEAAYDALAREGATVALAESLTGGAVTAALTAVPGASRVVVGGVVAYETRLKAELLGVDEDLLRRRGAVDPDVARQMAAGVRRVLGATYGVATTGAAGPDPAPGGTEVADVPAGTAYIAVSGPSGTQVHHVRLGGDRAEVRTAVVDEALAALASAVRGS